MNNSHLIETSKTFWENTYNQNINKMIGVCYRYTANRQIAEDLAHDAFILAYEKVESFEGKGPFEAWMRRIVVNVCLQYLREQHKKQYLNHWILNETYTLETHDENPNTENTDFTEAELLEAINQLPEHHKLVFNMYVIDKFTHAQIGKELGISEGTSKSHLARARKKIKELLNQKLDSDKKKKSAFLLFFWNIDSIYKKRFKNFEIPNQKVFSFDSFNQPSFFIPSSKTSVSLLPNDLSAGIAVLSMAFLSLFFLQKTLNTGFLANNTETNKSNNFAETGILDINPESTATISENPIMLSENKKPEDMKNLKTIGALLLTGTSLAMPSNEQNQVKPKTAIQKEAKPNATLNQQTDSNLTININAPNEQGKNSTTTINIDEKSNFDKDVDMAGTFSAKKLFWSAQNNELYFMGKSMVSFGKNRYVGSGSSSFLGKVHYLVMHGKPVILDESKKTYIKLCGKKYNLARLSTKTAIEKYGDAGKKGAIEISLAEKK